MKSRIVLTLVFLGGIAVAVAGCGRGTAVTGNGPAKVVAAFYPLAFAAEQVGRPRVSVENLTPAGAEPHDLELTPREVGDVLRADVVLYLGDGFQPALQKAVEGRKGRSVDLLARQQLRRASDESGRPAADPHVWLDPVRYAEMARRIASALGSTAGAGPVAGRLRALDGEYHRGLARCSRHEIVTSHAAFGYLAARYGLRQVPLQGLSPEAEPGPQAVRRLVQEVKRTRATTVFFETLVSPKLAHTVAREAGARTAVLDPLEGLTEAELDRGGDYFSVMRANLHALREALGCR